MMPSTQTNTDKQAIDILFSFLRDIIFLPEKAELDLALLPYEFQDLGEGMQYLSKCVLENKKFVSALAKGNFQSDPPSVENIIAAPAKALQGSLRHIAWQMQQVAKGDYGQQINYMGDFAENFNIMVHQLEERTSNLMHEKAVIEQKNTELTQIQELFYIITLEAPDMVVLLDLENAEEYLLNNSAAALKEEAPDLVAKIRSELILYQAAYGTDNGKWDMHVVSDDPEPGKDVPASLYYSILSYAVPWNGRRAMAHILKDCTEETEKKRQLQSEAFRDPLTNLYNRRYGVGLIEKLSKNGEKFCLSLIDLDNLKYCNDVYGHSEGDAYILQATNLLGNVFCGIGETGKDVLCRIGGDEFLLISGSLTEEELDARLKSLRLELLNTSCDLDADFKRSFSYGTAAYLPSGDKTWNDILGDADAKMYQYKRANKPGIVRKETP